MPGFPENLLTRRELLARLGSLSSVLLLEGCGLPSIPDLGDDIGPRLNVRPSAPTGTPQLGLQVLRRGGARIGQIYVPPAYRPETPLPLAVLLHGAGQNSNELMNAHIEESGNAGRNLILVALDSSDYTWDRLSSGIFGPDIVNIQFGLGYAFARCAVDANYITIAGFSDGASYALGVGLANGDLATRVVAYSPGGIVAVTPVGKPDFFITHGINDTILPIDQASRTIVPALRDAGYLVEYREWDGGHGVTRTLLREAVTWMTQPPAP